MSAWCKISSNSPRLVDKLYLNGKELTELVIPEDIKEIRTNLFSCSSITKVTIGEHVTSIDEGAFSGCKNLTSLTIGNGITEIKEHTFDGCDNLTFISIGENVKNIWYHVFTSNAITQFYSHAQTPPHLVIKTIGSGPNLRDYTTFDNLYLKFSSETTLYVPARCGSKYKLSAWGQYFKNIVEMD